MSSKIIFDFIKVPQKIDPLLCPAQWSSTMSIHQYRIPYEISLKYIRNRDKVLDWGCGNGHFSYFLLHNGCITTGYSYDCLPPLLKNATAFSFQPGSLDNFVDLPFPCEEFDLVFSVGVLEHVHEMGGSQNASLKEVWRVLNNGGLFLCYHFPNRTSWIEFTVRLINKMFGTKYHTHTKLFSKNDIHFLFFSNNFKIIQYKRYNFIPRNRLKFLPMIIKNSHVSVMVIDLIDKMFSIILPWFCQNWYVVAQKQDIAVTDT
ncbi:MAG: class I SAM-dependent methyltransferase [Candidatus Cloacimonas sp.]|jgi:SAM-dependent methyltransferase|nr:class I SAM-dependent methyltransferase [Candidatus Cloacimonas sp.]